MRVAIVGSGISGLFAAYRLAKDHDLTIFEADNRLGGHANTQYVANDQGHTVGIDTGFIVHNDRNYPLLLEMFDALGVETQDSEMSFSVSDADSDIYYRATNLSTIFAHRRNLVKPAVWKMLYEIFRFNRIGRKHLALTKTDPDAAGKPLSTEEFLDRKGFSQNFIDLYLVPLGASIWSADPQAFMQFPIVSLLRFLNNHGLISVGDRPQWRTVTGGSIEYLKKLKSFLEEHGAKFELSTPVLGITRANFDKDPSEKSACTITTNGGTFDFDAVIVACHSDQALKMLEDPTGSETELLGDIDYQANTATLHTDDSVMPPNRKQWASWNYLTSSGTSAQLTYDMNILQRFSDSKGRVMPDSQHWFVSLNCSDLIDPEKTFYEVEYAHPVYNARTVKAQERYRDLLDDVNQTRTAFCGAYWFYGFHEDGAKSGDLAAEAINQLASEGCLND